MRQTVNLNQFIWIWNECQGQSTPRHHHQICRFLSENWQNKENALLLMAFRNSGKSTLVGLFCAWALYLQPSLRILVMAADYELAKKMVRNVKRIIEKHPLTKSLCPRQKDQWASDRFTVCRPKEWRDPSVLGRGISANITGCRADIIICDDVEVPKTCDTAHKRKDLRQKLSELEFVLVPTGLQLYVGTPHTAETIYNTKDGFLKDFKSFVLPILDEEGCSVWPERFPLNKIEELRQRSGPSKFKSQMMLIPTAFEGGRLDTSRLIFYDTALSYCQTNLSAILKIGDEKMVSASCWWDPSFGKKEKGDASVIACVFSDAQGMYYLHAIEYMTVENFENSAEVQCRKVADFVEKNYLPSVCVETNGIGKFLPALLKAEIQKRRLRCAVLEKISHTPKEKRIIEAFDAILANGSLKVHQSVKQTPFMDELTEWSPSAFVHDDGLDAVAGCLLCETVRLPRTNVRPRQMPDWRY